MPKPKQTNSSGVSIEKRIADRYGDDQSPLLTDMNNYTSKNRHSSMPSNGSVMNGFGGETNKAYINTDSHGSIIRAYADNPGSLKVSTNGRGSSSSYIDNRASMPSNWEIAYTQLGEKYFLE